MIILGIESTCDETGVAIVEDGVKLISSEVATSLNFMKKFGGVVPEVAAREQVKVIIPTIERVLLGFDLERVDAIAVSSGPGLIGSLLIGVETAKALALSLNKPLISVNHLVGHVFASWIESDELPSFPLVALIVSGGHTDIVFMKDQKTFELMGSTLDDAAGEAFDKAARILGLGYPGGPEIEKLAVSFNGQDSGLKLSTPMFGPDNFDFSFSGVKTAVLNFVNTNKNADKKSVAFAFQESICKVLVEKTIRAINKKNAKTIVVGGGVSANERLKNLFEEKSKENGFQLFFPQKKFSVDNGAMIASAAFFKKNFVDPLELQANPNQHF